MITNLYNKILATLCVAAAGSLPMAARTDLLNENFDSAWSGNFISLELDGAAPSPAINAYFMDTYGVSQPWWPLKDSENSKDRFISSHSFYSNPGASNDWLVSRAIDVPTVGFELSFEAQSVPVRAGESHALSDLWVFITDQPVTRDWQPSAADATYHLESVSAGTNRDIVEGDFASYTYNLDAYAGKRIYISFANLNNDKDILALNNILVSRSDAAELSCSAPAYTLTGDYEVSCEVAATEQSLTNWTLTLQRGDDTLTYGEATLEAGKSLTHNFTLSIAADALSECTITLTADGILPLTRSVTTTGMAFMPERRVMLEETTGTWCGNCPSGIYTIENLCEEPEYRDRLFPISIHVGDDPMKVEEYQYMFGIGAVAPVMRVNRGQDVIMVGNLDFKYDPANPKTAAGKILEYFNQIAIADISLSANYDAVNNSLLNVTAKVTPAVTIDGSRYRMGYVVTENNVYNPDLKNSKWCQQNYLSGDKLVGEENPFFHLPSKIRGMRFHDVARQLFDFHGQENSMPARSIAAQETVVLERVLEIATVTTADQPSIKPQNLYLTAYLIDSRTAEVVNCARIPLSEEPEKKFTLTDLLSTLDAEMTVTDTDSKVEYFNLQGMPVANPAATPGIYLMRQGGKTVKVVM